MTLRVGDVTIDRLIEIEGPFMVARDMFPTLSSDVLESERGWLESIGAIGAEDRLIFSFQSYVVRTPHHTILIDSCIGNDKDRPTRPEWNQKRDRAFMDGLAKLGLGVDDIDVVLCTHLHADHVGWNTRLENGRHVPTFPKARYVFGRAEYDHWTAQNAKAPIYPFVDSVLPVVEAGRADLVASDHAIGDHIRLEPTPGHTPGHVAISLGREREEALFLGDAIHSPLQLRHPDLSPRFDLDGVEAAATRTRILERLAGNGALCCTAHFPSPSVGRIEWRGGGFACTAFD